MSHRKTLDRLRDAMLEGMTDAELTAIIGTDPGDLSDFTDADLQAIASGTAGPELAARFDAATTHSTKAPS